MDLPNNIRHSAKVKKYKETMEKINKYALNGISANQACIKLGIKYRTYFTMRKFLIDNNMTKHGNTICEQKTEQETEVQSNKKPTKQNIPITIQESSLSVNNIPNNTMTTTESDNFFNKPKSGKRSDAQKQWINDIKKTGITNPEIKKSFDELDKQESNKRNIQNEKKKTLYKKGEFINQFNDQPYQSECVTEIYEKINTKK